MRPFSHVLAIFYLAVGIAPFFAHASSTPLPDGVPQAHMDQLSSIRKEMQRHGADLDSKLEALKTAGHPFESTDCQNVVDEYMDTIRPLGEQLAVLNQQHSTNLGNVARAAVAGGLNRNYHRQGYNYIPIRKNLLTTDRNG
ncbi:hypothetical protein F5148DRAFT_1371842 [Russula earlei]|uniref:Uncharacterized protein n=1 Tax=Russula earlei TaxID=71964 RepID=A0ACC0TU51_9AGAM|nr:hypothetical protein F5148DRAFT_1371842 [Russula earlei]